MNFRRIPIALAFVLVFFSAQTAAAFYCSPNNSPNFVTVSVNATTQNCSTADTLDFTGNDGHKIIVTTNFPSGNAVVTVQVYENGFVQDPLAVSLNLQCGNIGLGGGAVTYATFATFVLATFSSPSFSSDCSLSYLDKNGYPVSHGFTSARATFVGDPTVWGFVGGFFVNNGWFDQVAPGVTLSGLSGIGADPVTILAEFTEDITGFSAGDVALQNLTLSNFSALSSTQFEFDVTAIAGGQASLSIAASSVIDASGNGNTVSNTLSEAVDTTPPDVAITGFPAQITGPQIFDATITFSGPVSGFDAGDITLSGAIITNLVGIDTVFTATISATGLADVVMFIAPDVAVNNLGIGNVQSNTATAIDASPARSSALISQFMQTRANALLANQPELAGFLRESRTARFKVDITDQAGDFATASEDGPLWWQLNANWINSAGAKSAYVFGAVGSHSAISENFLLGAMLQYDGLTETNGTALIRGQGWMLGPYFVAKLPDQPLFVEGSVMYGQTSNTISPLGTFTDIFQSERFLATLGVSGEIAQNSLTLFPFLDANYTTDAQKAYLDGLGNNVAAQTVTLAQIEAGLDFELGIGIGATLNGGVSGFWTRSTGAPDVVPEFEGGRARIDLGVNYEVGNLGSIGFSGFYDGIGAGAYESYGAEFRYFSSF